jgi:gamma-glutamyltranspeptidase/glutathione hydrolase
MQDLTEYQSQWREPLVANWRQYKVVSAPPPSSGGFAVIQLLKMKELLDEEFKGLVPNSAQYVHLIAEIEKRVFADRAEYLGDPDFVDVPIERLISDEYIAQRAAQVNPHSISQLDSVQPGLESPNTTHFSIVDKWGNAVSNTYTINWNYGSGVVVEGAGFILNNEMDDFSTKPGVANIYGVVGGVANEIQPSKRMLSSMSPTILIDDERIRMVLGTPGGSTIFTSVFQGIVNVIDNGMSASASVGASRFHHQLLPPELVTTSVSIPLPEQTVLELQEKGYRVEPHGWEFGDLQLIESRFGETNAASDPRGIGVSGVIQ